MQTGASVKLEQYDVTVLDHIVASLLTILARRLNKDNQDVNKMYMRVCTDISTYLGSRLASRLLEVLEVHHLGHDEALLKVRVNSARRLRSLGALLYGPSLHLVLAGSEEVDQLQSPIPSDDDLGERAMNANSSGDGNVHNKCPQHLPGGAVRLQVRLPLIFGQLDQLVLEYSAERNHGGVRVRLVQIFLDLDQPEGIYV